MFKNVWLAVAAFAFLTQINPILGDDVEDLLKKLDAAVDDAIVKAAATLEEAMAHVDTFALYINETGTSMINDTLKQRMESLDTLKRKAKKADVDIDDCLGDDETALTTLATTSTKDMVDCEVKEITNAYEFVHDALIKAQSALSYVENIRQEVKNCSNILEEEVCLADLAQFVEDAITSLPREIEMNAATSAAQITKYIETQLVVCANDAYEKYYMATLTLIEKIDACVETKITT